MYIRINCVAVFVAVFEHQFALIPIATHTFHAHSVAVAHQFFGEETGEMTDATDDIAAEEVFGVAHAQHPPNPALIFDFFHRVHMHVDGSCSNNDFPIVAHLCFVVIQHGEHFQSLVPPIHLAIALIDVFMCHLVAQSFVVKRVDFHKDMRRFIADNGVACLIHVLVGDATILVLDFVVPFE